MIDNEEDFLIAEQRHEELISSIKSLVDVLSAKDDMYLKNIVKQTNTFDGLIKTLITKEPSKELPKDDTIIVSKLEDLNIKLLNSISALRLDLFNYSKKEEQWKFDVTRTREGLIESLTATKII